MTENRTFDAARSAAIRDLLMETVEASPAVRRRRQIRIGVAIIAAAVVGGLGAGGAALALSGVSLFGGGPASVVVTDTPSPSPTPTQTPTPAPTPTPVATVAPVRVPLSCDTLLPQSVAEAMVGMPLVPLAPSAAPGPLGFADERAGSLLCGWLSPAGAPNGTYTPTVVLTIVPDVTAEDYRATSDGIDLGSYPTIPGFGEGSREACTIGTSYPLCALVDRVAGSGVQLVVVPATLDISESTLSAARERFSAVADAVAGAGASGPLWEPAGPNLAGVTDCDGLATTQQLVDLTGDPTMYNFRSYEGEFRIATFRSNAQVGGYGCAWSGAGAGGAMSASVLPGGAGYFTTSSPIGGGAWTPTTGYPGEAYVSPDGTEIAVLVDNAWFDLRVPAEQTALLPQFAALVVSNVQAAGPGPTASR
ncbi:hypothetical protein VD659_10575 [Herbiconiux sp. 11R-BC]|uniref:hypothetical protein n=1 Tax=Herbiconiux sp. 11R-BC TaxID=3111637 RepID=UPI003C02ED32